MTSQTGKFLAGQIEHINFGITVFTQHQSHLFTVWGPGWRAVKAGKISTRMSPHQLGLLEVLEICKLRDAAPESVEFYCVVPKTLETSTELSDVVAPRIKDICDIVLKRLGEMGVEVSNRTN